jgi:hypothetical protein
MFCIDSSGNLNHHSIQVSGKKFYAQQKKPAGHGFKMNYSGYFVLK